MNRMRCLNKMKDQNPTCMDFLSSLHTNLHSVRRSGVRVSVATSSVAKQVVTVLQLNVNVKGPRILPLKRLIV